MHSINVLRSAYRTLAAFCLREVSNHIVRYPPSSAQNLSAAIYLLRMIHIQRFYVKLICESILWQYVYRSESVQTLSQTSAAQRRAQAKASEYRHARVCWPARLVVTAFPWVDCNGPYHPDAVAKDVEDGARTLLLCFRTMCEYHLRTVSCIVSLGRKVSPDARRGFCHAVRP